MPEIQIFIENSPPRSGKDTVADMVVSDFPSIINVDTQSFKEGLIAIALTVSGVSREEWEARYDTMKEIPWDRLGGLSQRQYLIKISEEWVKPVHGKDHFGKLVALSTRDSYNRAVAKYADTKQLVFIPDGGFPEEIQPLIDEFGSDSVNILQWGRNGCSFENDSRDYITAYPKSTYWLGYNNDSIESFYGTFIRHVNGILKAKGW